MKKIRLAFISNYVNCNTPPPPPLPPSPSTEISSRLHCSPLSRLAPSTDRSRPLSSPPPLSLHRVVPRPRHRGRLRRRSEGTAASPHPSASRRRRGKIPPVVVVLRSDVDASRRPPPPCSRVVHRPPPARRHSRRRRHRVLLHPLSAIIAQSNISSRSRQRDIIAAPRHCCRRPSPQPVTSSSAPHAQTSILAKNAIKRSC